ncbi:hypothetical protein [Halomonas casei]|uniref:hypothetical protein n=1 Tax=Halomonas casei TaxID=2742613 RepID=UPI003CFB8EA0
MKGLAREIFSMKQGGKISSRLRSTPLFGMKVSGLGGDRAGAPWWWLSARGAVLVWHALASLASIQILASSATGIDYPLPEKKA